MSSSSAPDPSAHAGARLADGDLDVVVLDARARRRDAARRPLARAVARRAADPRAARRLGRARGAGGRRDADHRHRRLAGRRLRHDARLPRADARPAGAGLCRQLPRAAGGARRGARAHARIEVRHGVTVDARRRHARVRRRRARGRRRGRDRGASRGGRRRHRRRGRGRRAPAARLRAGRAGRQVWRDAPHAGSPTSASRRTAPSRCCRKAITTGSSGRPRPSAPRELLALDDAAFLAALARHFGTRARGFTRVADRRTFPLALEFAPTAVGTRCVVARQRRADAAPGRRPGLQPRAARRRASWRRSCWTRRATSIGDARDARPLRRDAAGATAGPASRSRTGSSASSATTCRSCAGRAGWRSLCSTRFRRRSARSRAR